MEWWWWLRWRSPAAATDGDAGENGGVNGDSNADSSGGEGGTFGEAGSDEGNTSQSTSGADTNADTGSAEDEGDGEGFVMMPDGGPGNECDPKEQDCPDGQKCTAWANDGGTFWNANRCVDETGEGVSGDVCMVEGGGVSGDRQLLGRAHLHEHRRGGPRVVHLVSARATTRAARPGTSARSTTTVCSPSAWSRAIRCCPTCPEGQSCIDTPNQRFHLLQRRLGHRGGPTAIRARPPTARTPATRDTGADPAPPTAPTSNCCTPYCDVTEASPCQQPDQCISFFGEGDAPPEYTNVGVCVLP